MKYDDYSIQDFAGDSFFIRWVKHPDEESDWFWKSFIKENPECSTTIEKARELVSLLDFPSHDLSEVELSSMRNNLLMRLRADREEHKDNKVLQARSLAIDGRWLKLAAAIIIIPLVSSLMFLVMKDSDGRLPLLGAGQKGSIERRVNPVGQKSVLFLSDGTKVWLNAASKLSYTSDFSEQDTREVYLEGEAFFEVAHNKNKPFIVHTSSIKIKVLGTSFNVKSYSEEKTIETTLVNGKVRIEQADARGNRIGDVELKPNQCAVFTKTSKIINIKEVEADNSMSWKRETLVFDEESIDNVILQMERWFNVEIHVDDKGSLDCKLTANIQEESLEEVLKLIETTHNIHYSIIGNQVFIEGKLCETENE
ncbi:MAG TPA: FecR family protein [Chryseolinea sp.]|nr:FecR family protein [Chryseolinea sp.]